jgi:hypothetical protein
MFPLMFLSGYFYLKEGRKERGKLGKKKHTLEEAKNEFIKRGYIPQFQQYNNNGEKLLAKTQEGYKVEINLRNLKSNKCPSVFSPNNPHTIENIKLWIQLINKQDEIELISDKYIDSSKPLKFLCKKKNCGETFEASWANISKIKDIEYNSNGCSYCHGKKVGLSNCLATKFPQLISEWHPILNGDLTPWDVTYGSHQNVWWLCSNENCNNEWDTSVKDRSSAGHQCPLCATSRGEKQIEKYLKENNIEYIHDYKFNDCKNIHKLKFDFYLFNYNMCIEYDGKHHYEPIDYFGGQEDFEKVKKLDQIKNTYCKQNNILLYRIPYWEFDNIEIILDNIINNKDNHLDFAV